MKKFFGIGLLALLTTAYFTSSCSRDDLSGSMIEAKKATFNDNFIAEYGNIAPNHDWGFGTSNGTRAFTRSGNTSGSYTPWPSTHQYYDANGNLIASANMNHNQWGSTDLQSMPYGGWIFPDPLTEGQKLRVQKYFQANPNLSYEDPRYANFYVQQVYTGGTDAPTTGNHETTVAANGQGHQGMTLNQLTVGQAASHINDFNAGTCTTSQVLNHEGKTQSDQITLMLNVDDTSCFGFHETSGSNVNSNENSDVYNHNDKMALVSAAVIDAWAAQNGNPGEAVVDKWNRSFMGFDYELLPESDIVMDTYALLSQVPNLNNIPYAWDGQKVMTIGEVPEDTEGTPDTKNDDFDLFPYFANHAIGSNNASCTTENGKIVCYFPQYSAITFGQGNQDWSPYSKLVIEFEASPINGSVMNTSFSIGDTKVEVALNNEHWWGDDQGPTISTYDGSTGTLNITSVKLIGKTVPGTSGTTYNPADYYNPTYLLGDTDADKIAFYSTNTNMYGGTILNLTEDEMKTTQDGKTCLNLVKFRQLKNDGYHPISTDLKTWVKWQAACDGYYSDWIVTLTEAQRIPTTESTTKIVLWQSGRVFCEDLGSVGATDIDYNDVVFDAWIYVKRTDNDPNTDVFHSAFIQLLAAGGTIPIQVAGENVHEKFGAAMDEMVNTYRADQSNIGSAKHAEYGVDSHVSFPAKIVITNSGMFGGEINIKNIPIVVRTGNTAVELTAGNAYTSDAPLKFMAPIGTKWAAERVRFGYAYPSFYAWVANPTNTPWGNLNTFYTYEGFMPDVSTYAPTAAEIVAATPNTDDDDMVVDTEGIYTATWSGTQAFTVDADGKWSGNVTFDNNYSAFNNMGYGTYIRVYGYGTSNDWQVQLARQLNRDDWTWTELTAYQQSGTTANTSTAITFGPLSAEEAQAIKNDGLLIVHGKNFVVNYINIDNSGF